MNQPGFGMDMSQAMQYQMAAPQEEGGSSPSKRKRDSDEEDEDMAPEDSPPPPKRTTGRERKAVKKYADEGSDDDEDGPKKGRKKKKSKKGKEKEEGESKEEKKARSKKRPGQPKRGRTAYSYYLADKQKELKNIHKDMSLTEATKMASLEWKSMGAAERRKYEELSAIDKKRAAKEMERFEQMEKLKEEEKKLLEISGLPIDMEPDIVEPKKRGRPAAKDSKKAKGPVLTGFASYYRQSMPGLKARKAGTGLSEADLAREIGAAWKAMAPTDRARFALMANEISRPGATETQTAMTQSSAMNYLAQYADAKVGGAAAAAALLEKSAGQSKKRGRPKAADVEVRKKADMMLGLPTPPKQAPQFYEDTEFHKTILEMSAKPNKSNITHKDILAAVGRKWMNLSPESKGIFVVNEKKDAERYARELKEFQESKLHLIQGVKKPKKPYSPYMIYVNAWRDKVMSQLKFTDPGQVGQYLSAAWEKLTDDKKAEYMVNYEQGKQKYKQEHEKNDKTLSESLADGIQASKGYHAWTGLQAQLTQMGALGMNNKDGTYHPAGWQWWESSNLNSLVKKVVSQQEVLGLIGHYKPQVQNYYANPVAHPYPIGKLQEVQIQQLQNAGYAQEIVNSIMHELYNNPSGNNQQSQQSQQQPQPMQMQPQQMQTAQPQMLQQQGGQPIQQVAMAGQPQQPTPMQS